MTDLDELLNRVAPTRDQIDRGTLAHQLDALLSATEPDDESLTDSRLRDMLAAYVAGLRGEIPTISD